ncbi:hypothetical protein A152_0023385 [Vibrio tasmaniensis 1F-187]|uniref:hypothetical protein n=1 Tax=Vibrio TaxID=662 RepID=UPI0002E35F26|nr:hypothetical protein [Vibrio tasmaniensis]OEF64974.1 hypothetical protein A152_00320 [Vibrio tasmaniensis 1F-187]
MVNSVLNSREGLDEGTWLLEQEVSLAITAVLSSLGQMNLEYDVHSQAVREFSQAFNVVLTSYRKGNINYDMAHSLINKIKLGFIDGSQALQNREINRKIRNEQRAEQREQDGTSASYRRNMRVNNQSFNVRFMASCANTECLMRNANIDMEDDAFQDYIEAATQDKRSDVMQVIGVALIVNPYLVPLQRIVLADVAESATKGNFDPALAYAMGSGVAYRLRLLNFSNRTQATSESVASYFSGNVLSDDK